MRMLWYPDHILGQPRGLPPPNLLLRLRCLLLPSCTSAFLLLSLRYLSSSASACNHYANFTDGHYTHDLGFLPAPDQINLLRPYPLKVLTMLVYYFWILAGMVPDSQY